MHTRNPFITTFAPDDPDLGGGTDPDPTPDPTPDPAPQPTTQDPAPAEPAPVQETPEPETFSADYVKQLRQEAASYRTRIKAEAEEAAKKAREELTQSIGKALGLIKDDEPADPQKIIEQAQAQTAEAEKRAKATAVELAVFRAAGKHNANIDALADSLTFQKKAQALDPTADDFASQVDALIKDTVDSNPSKFKNVQVAASTGGTHHTGDNTGQLTREQLAALPPAERLKAAQEGRLTSLLRKQ